MELDPLVTNLPKILCNKGISFPTLDSLVRFASIAPRFPLTTAVLQVTLVFTRFKYRNKVPLPPMDLTRDRIHTSGHIVWSSVTPPR